MKGIIELENLEFFAYHGCFEAEQVVGNKFLVNVALHYDCARPAESDLITDALNYQKAYELIAQEMMKRSHLLEHVANRIVNVLYEHFPEIKVARVKIAKLNPPLGGKIGATCVTIEK